MVGDDGPDGKRARRMVVAAGALAAPDLVDVETMAVLRKRWVAKTLTARRFSTAVDDLELIALDRFPTLPHARRAYELRATVTAYDAVYVALAEALGCELLTGDARLSRGSGPRCPIRVLT